MPNTVSWYLCGLAAAIGYVGWGNGMTPVAALLGLVWAACASRSIAFAAAAMYYLAGSRALPAAADVFFGRETAMLEGVVLWMGSAVILAAPWGVLHPGRRGGQAPLRLLIIYAVLLLPPYGLVAWLHPLLGAGQVLPGFGLLSLITGAALTAFGAYLAQRFPDRVPAACLVLGVCLALAGAAMSPPATSPLWAGVATADGREPRGLMEEVVRYSKTEKHVLDALQAKPEAKAVVLPEAYVGTWNLNAKRALKSLLDKPLSEREAFALVGTAVPIEGSALASNSLMIYDGQVWARYDARFTVPFGMWHPWTGDGTEPTFALFGTVQVGQQRALMSLCFEDLLLGLHLPSLLLERPDVIVSAANGWWVRNSSAEVVQREHIEAIARIFDLPLVRAVNRH